MNQQLEKSVAIVLDWYFVLKTSFFTSSCRSFFLIHSLLFKSHAVKTGVTDWREHLAMLISNPTKHEDRDKKSIISLGDALSESFCHVPSLWS